MELAGDQSSPRDPQDVLSGPQCPTASEPGHPQRYLSHSHGPQHTEKHIFIQKSHPPPSQPSPESPTSCPSLSHATSGAGKPFVSHSRVRGCPARLDTLVMRPSSRMLGGT